jgi:4-hydroxy-tetrahydrodipicolinate synthase
MTGATYLDGIKQFLKAHAEGKRAEALDEYERWLPLVNYENRQCGISNCKLLTEEDRIISSEAVRGPLQALHRDTRGGPTEIAARIDP